MSLHEDVLNSQTYFDGHILRLRVETVKLADGTVSTRELVDHRPAVAIIPVLDDGRMVLVKQYRNSIKQALLEFPAGGVEAHESFVQAAKRELQEETGYSASKLRYWTQIVMTPGFCDEILHIFLATGLKQGNVCFDEDERVEVCLLSVEELKEQMLNNKTIVDGKSQLMFFRYLYSCG